MSAFLFLFAVGGVGKASALSMPSTARGGREADLRGRAERGVLLLLVCGPADQASRSVENRDLAVDVMMHADLGAHEMGAGRMRRNLQARSVPRHRVVGRDDALLLKAENVAPLRLGDRHEGARRIRRLDREAGVVGRQIMIADKGVGRFDVSDPSQGQLLGQAVLKRAERPLRAAARLWRISRDVLDPQLAQRPPDLRQYALGDLAARFRRMEVMAAAVAVERAEQALGRDRLDQAAKARERPFFRDEERRINLARGVVERDDEVERPLAVEPGVPRGVLMQHHADHRPALPFASMRPAPRRLSQKAAILQVGLGPGVAPAKAVIADEMLVKMLRGEAQVTLAVKPRDLLGVGVRNRPAGAPPQAAIRQPLFALVLEPPAPAPKRPLAHPQQLRRFELAQNASLPAAQHIAKLQHSQSLPLLRPPHAAPPKRAIMHRTDHVLPGPDTSCAPYRRRAAALPGRPLASIGVPLRQRPEPALSAHRLAVQDAALSRRKHGFDSRWARQGLERSADLPLFVRILSPA